MWGRQLVSHRITLPTLTTMEIQIVCYLVNEEPAWQVYFTDGTGIGSPTEESLIAACPGAKDWLANNQARTTRRFSSEIDPGRTIEQKLQSIGLTVDSLKRALGL
jgi:hypothetical protein